MSKLFLVALLSLVAAITAIEINVKTATVDNEGPMNNLHARVKNAIINQPKGRRNFGNVRIAGGVPASAGDFPFLVAIGGRSDNAVFCCGALLSSRYVLTAAHCLQDDPSQPTYYSASNLFITVGKTDLKNAAVGKVINILKKINHPNYDATNVVNDVALLQLAEDVPEDLSKNIQYVNLTSSAPTTGQVLWAAGWGLLPSGSTPNVPYKVQVPVKSGVSVCQGSSPQNFCAGAGDGKDTCQGDSGSSVVYKPTGATRWVTVGITSYGTSDQCGATGVVGAYTNVVNYVSWITTTAGQAPISTVPGTTSSPTKDPDSASLAHLSYLVVLFISLVYYFAY